MPSTPRVGPLLWCLTVQFFAVQAIVASGFTGGYSWSGNTISDLGNTSCGAYGGRAVCSPGHLLMNASFVVLGLTMLGGAVLVSRQLARGSRLAAAGFAGVGLGGLGTVVVGLFPENTVGGLHAAGAALPFVFGNVGIVVLGVWNGRLPAGLRVCTVAAGVVGLVGLPLFLSHTYVGLGIGGTERVTAYPQDVWLVLIGAYLLMRVAPPTLIDGAGHRKGGCSSAR